jgi:hypothetical protein
VFSVFSQETIYGVLVIINEEKLMMVTISGLRMTMLIEQIRTGRIIIKHDEEFADQLKSITS